jgi:predicted membrane chloride channel (bestrophin family)
MGGPGHGEGPAERLVMTQLAIQYVLMAEACVWMRCLSVPTRTVADQAIQAPYYSGRKKMRVK